MSRVWSSNHTADSTSPDTANPANVSGQRACATSCTCEAARSARSRRSASAAVNLIVNGGSLTLHSTVLTLNDDVVVTAGLYPNPDREGRVPDERWADAFAVNVTGPFVVADEAEIVRAAEVLVVVESRERGGSLITARMALDRDVQFLATGESE